MTHDVFVSYKTRKFSEHARAVVDALKADGLAVWFDQDILDDKATGRVSRPKEELIGILTDAASSARASVIFEAEMELVLLYEGQSVEALLAQNEIMIDDMGAPIAWNWQKLEIDASKNPVVIYATSNMVVAGRLNEGQSETYSDDADMLDTVLRIVRNTLAR